MGCKKNHLKLEFRWSQQEKAWIKKEIVSYINFYLHTCSSVNEIWYFIDFFLKEGLRQEVGSGSLIGEAYDSKGEKIYCERCTITIVEFTINLTGDKISGVGPLIKVIHVSMCHF